MLSLTSEQYFASLYERKMLPSWETSSLLTQKGHGV